MPHNIEIVIQADDLPAGRDTALALREFFQRRVWDYQVRDGGPLVFGMKHPAATIAASVTTKFTPDAMKRAGAFQVVGKAMEDRTIQAPLPPRAMDLVLDSPAYPSSRGELLEFLSSALLTVAADRAKDHPGSGDGELADAMLIALDAIVALDPTRRPLLERFLEGSDNDPDRG